MEDLLIIHSYILAYILATSRHLADKVYRPLLVSNPGRQTATIDGLTIPGALVHTATWYVWMYEWLKVLIVR